MTVLPPGAIARPAPAAPPSSGGGGFRAHLAQAGEAAEPSGGVAAGSQTARGPGGVAPAAPPPEGHLSVNAPAGAVDPARAGAAFLRRALEGQRGLDAAVAAARHGRTFSPAELLGLQARIYRATEAVQLFSKTVEQTSAAVQQTLRTPV